MARFFDIDAANGTLAEVQPLLVLLRDHREELVRLRDQVLERQASLETGVETPADGGPAVRGVGPGREPDDVRTLRLRMQGLIDQMQAAVVRIDELGVTLRDIQSGLIDFPALVSGRQVWLCWRLGEGDIDWWHELSDGFGGRRPLAELT